MHFMAVESRKCSGFAIYSYFEDSVFTLFRQLACSHEDLSSTDSSNFCLAESTLWLPNHRAASLTEHLSRIYS